MRIALDLRKIESSGIGRYMRSIVEALLREAPEHEYVLIIPLGSEHLLKLNGAKSKVLPVDIPYYSIREQLAIPALLAKHRVDLFHSPHFVVPVLRTCPVVVNIHDVIYMARRDELKSRLTFVGCRDHELRIHKERNCSISEAKSRQDLRCALRH